MVDNLEKDIAQIVTSVMGIDLSTLDPNIKFSNIPSWDSFNNLMLISKFEEVYNVNFTAVEIEQTQTISDLMTLIRKKLQQK